MIWCSTAASVPPSWRPVTPSHLPFTPPRSLGPSRSIKDRRVFPGSCCCKSTSKRPGEPLPRPKARSRQFRKSVSLLRNVISAFSRNLTSRFPGTQGEVAGSFASRQASPEARRAIFGDSQFRKSACRNVISAFSRNLTSQIDKG